MRRLSVMLAVLIIGLSSCSSDTDTPPRSSSNDLEALLLKPLGLEEVPKSKRDPIGDRETVGATQVVKRDSFFLSVPKTWVSLDVSGRDGVVLAYGEEGTGESLNVIRTSSPSILRPTDVREELESGGAKDVEFLPPILLDGVKSTTVLAKFTSPTRLFTCQILVNKDGSSYVLTVAGLDRDSTVESARTIGSSFSWA